MKIVHVISSLDHRCGGPTTALVAMVRAQVQAGHAVSVVSTFSKSQQPTAAQHLKKFGADVRLLGPCFGPTMWHPSLGATLTDAIHGANLVHIHAVWEEIQHRAAVVSRRLRVPYIITTHGMLDPWSLSQRSLKKRLYMALRLRKNLNRAAAIHFTTETERQLASSLQIAAPSVIEPYCLDLAEFNQLPARGKFRANYPQIGDRKIVLFLSRLHRKKGLDLLLPAFATAAGKDTVLVLAGPVAPEYEPTLDRLIALHGLTDRVIKTGMLYNGSRVAALADADLFVLPSYQENFGIAVVEALAAGCPVLISDQVNIHPQVSRAAVGAVVPMDTSALARELSHWLSDDDERQRTSVRARDYAMHTFDLERSERRWNRLYRDVIGQQLRGQVDRQIPAGAAVHTGMTALVRHHTH